MLRWNISSQVLPILTDHAQACGISGWERLSDDSHHAVPQKLQRSMGRSWTPCCKQML